MADNSAAIGSNRPSVALKAIQAAEGPEIGKTEPKGSEEAERASTAVLAKARRAFPHNQDPKLTSKLFRMRLWAILAVLNAQHEALNNRSFEQLAVVH